MRLRLENINKIQKASIDLNALTVIAGVNDSGKSTVGKMLFSIIKSMRNMDNHHGVLIRERIEDKLGALYMRIITANHRLDSVDVKKELALPDKFSELKNTFLSDHNIDGTWFDERIAKVQELGITPRIAQGIITALKELKEELLEDKSPNGMLRKELAHTFRSEFKNNVCSYDTAESRIAYADLRDEDVLNVILSNNEIKSLIFESTEERQIVDATMVESPLYLHLMDSLIDGFAVAGPIGKRRMWTNVNYHVKDMVTKLRDFRYVDKYIQSKDERIESIKRIIDGAFVYDEEQRDIYLQKGEHRHSPVNVASGIKTFGVLQILLETGAIDENRMLIWDEPENHLHPEWQIKFAQMMVELAKSGITILVSSHSPYFIQALRYYADKLNMNKFVNYYLAEEGKDGLSNIEDMSEDLNMIFSRLARPMNDIINIGR